MFALITALLVLSCIVLFFIGLSYIDDKITKGTTGGEFPNGFGYVIIGWLVLNIGVYNWLSMAYNNHYDDKTLQINYSIPIEKKNDTYFYQNKDGHLVELAEKFLDTNLAEIHVTYTKESSSLGLWFDPHTDIKIGKKNIDIEKK